MNESELLPEQPDTDADALAQYLHAHQATLITTDGSYALSVHGQIIINKRVVPYHLVPDEGFLGKTAKWRKLDAEEKLALLQERWNNAACERLETQLRLCAERIAQLAREYELDPGSAYNAFQAKYERASDRCKVALARIDALQGTHAATRQAEKTRDAVNLSLYPESFTVAQQMKRHFIAVLGPTNSGKTHAAMEHLTQAQSGVYLAPLRLLALENYHRLLDANVPTSLITGEQRKIHPEATHIASTVEMFNPNRPIEVAVIDEIQLLDDPDRGAAWTAAVCGVPAGTVYLLGALEAEEAIRSLVKRVGGTLEVRKLQRKSPLEMEQQPLGSLKNLQPGDVLIAFSRREVLNWRDQAIEQGFAVSAIYGNLSPEVRQAQAARFVEGETKIVVGTDAIGMGLNTPARRVIFTTASKWDGYNEGIIAAPLAKQIAGRAGRFGAHEAGYVAGLDARTHKIIGTLLREKPEPLPSSGFFVAPNLDYLQQISAATGQTKLQTLLELFTKHINVHDEFFLPANLSDQIEKARWLDTLDLSLADRYQFSLCPISTKIPLLERALQDWARHRAEKRPAPLLRMEGMGGRNELQYLEDTCKLYAAYAWLGYRMPETFPNEDMAQMLMKSTSEKIDHLLQAQNTRSRHGKKPARRDDRRNDRSGGQHNSERSKRYGKG
ncbi:ATP-dependent RNA helicase SUPV3L1/SUV3 [Andreprevotia lacus DSM 23236]|jgi:ATP-dependent RNA helicase SUPV3L1/SUV3|uniref:ATP-dependent RNA helicase SUPV3L1/SUV3 n=1 Tax=Andreprevotia lacus DSM 23236 TaxID=1121001 RepID=A0A1W1XHW2_9NEIS|nr:helicase-related protein [Andreprevotia lacus]SMC23088.1 ATP-dependent RNA helicase SUPV3L1/SUV3 [Andreprevotia lacus DSM 23236]